MKVSTKRLKIYPMYLLEEYVSNFSVILVRVLDQKYWIEDKAED
jgi:hypothetical protein